MVVKEIVGLRDGPHLPGSPVARLVATEQQDRSSSGIKSEERSRAAGAQLFHVWVTAASDCVHEWPTQAWAVLGEKLDGLRYVSLFVG